MGFKRIIVSDSHLSVPVIVRQYFPTADDKLVELIVWGLTGYPCFWHIPRDGNTPLECFRTQLRQAKNSLLAGKTLCEQEDEAWSF